MADYFPKDFKGTFLYRTYFAPTNKLPYDTRIDDYNWFLIFLAQVVFYFFLHLAIRAFIPPPGDIRKYQETKKKMREYNTYYF